MTYTYEATRHTFRAPRGELSYHDVGEGEPLLLLHGSGPGVSGWANFAGNLPTFASRFRTIVLDMPGYGASEPTDGHPFLDAPEGVLALLDHLDLESVDIIGNSMGGGVGARLAADVPERVRRLVTIGGLGDSILSAAPPEGIRLLRKFTEEPTRERFMAWMESMVFDTAILTEELVERRFAQATDERSLAWARKLYSPTAASDAGRAAAAQVRWAHYSSIACPTLITWGRDDRVTPLDRMLVPMRLIPDCEVHIFPDSGHWVMIEQREAFESVVLAFLSRG